MRLTQAIVATLAVLTVTSCEAGTALASAPISEQCSFRGADVVCVQRWADKPDTTTVDTPAYDSTPGDPGVDYALIAERHPGSWPPKPEPGREQYFTPFEESLPNDFRPFAPVRQCRDGSMWDPVKIPACPNGNPGTVTWIHHDGTKVVVGPDSPHGLRWNGGEIR